jgi:hypothetical protein
MLPTEGEKCEKYLATAIDALNAASAELDQVHPALGGAFRTQQQRALSVVMELKAWLRQHVAFATARLGEPQQQENA